MIYCREYNGPVIVASPDGGVDIEEVAEKTPDRIMKMPVDVHTGIRPRCRLSENKRIYLRDCNYLSFVINYQAVFILLKGLRIAEMKIFFFSFRPSFQ